MKGSQYWDNLNDQINKMVEGTLNQENIKELSDRITSSVNSALEEAREQAKKASGEILNAGQSIKEDLKGEFDKVSFRQGPRPTYQAPHAGRREKGPGQYNSQRRPAVRNGRPPMPRNPVIKMKPVGGVAGILCMVFGGIGIGISSLFLLTTMMIYLTGVMYVPAGLIGGISAFTAAFGLMITRGVKKRKRLKRASQYLMLCGNRTYVNIAELSRATGRSIRYIIRDVKRMIRMGIYPEGHLDRQNTCLMLNQNIYNQYLNLEEERRRREREELEARKHPKAVTAQGGESQPSHEGESHKELDSLAAQGKEYVSRLRELNDEIEGEVISTKLFRMENLLEELFYRVSTHPDQISKTQRLMEYYLPMTIKLVQAYRDFDRISVPDNEILSAKAEIEKTLDTINRAFGEILNSLYRDAALDVTTDAQVLQSMMAREGLTNQMQSDKMREEDPAGQM